MEPTKERIIKDIIYYQKRLEQYVADKNDSKVLYVINKLSKLPINTVHLENTGVGRSVNALKKYGGEVTRASKELVTSWKDMVVQEDMSQEEPHVEPEEDVDSVYSSDNELGDGSEEGSSRADQIHDEKPRIVDDDSEENGNCDSNDESDDSKDGQNDMRYKSDDSEYNEQPKMKVSKNNKNGKSHTSKSYSHSNNSDGDNHGASSNPMKRKHTNDSSHHEKEEKHEIKRARHVESHSSYGNKSISSKDSSNSKHKSRSHDSGKSRETKSESKKEKEYKSENEKKKENSHSSKRDSSKSKTSNSEKLVKHKVEGESRKKSDSSSSRHKDKDSDRKEKHSSKENSNVEKSSSKKKSDEKEKHSKEKKATADVKDVKKSKIVNGIGSDSGASFAEALGMCGPISSKKKSSSSSSKPKPSTSERKVDLPPTSIFTPSNKFEDDLVPDMLKEAQLPPLNINISSLLPEITPHYKPLGIPLDLQQKKFVSDDEALSRVMSNKNQRTKVYSGNKGATKVESLFELCIRILQDNIDALEYTGGVPYLILKPILEKATADQLFNLEHHNPYLIEDTDELWKLHSEREFKTKKREEMETWRDMYMRCLDEREARLSFITANIKQSQDRSMPIRTTKMAYVDSFAKPPRNVLRQQARHGTSFSKPSTSSKLAGLAKSGEAGKISVPNPRSKTEERASATAVTKVKKAPLMAKTLSFLKNRFKR